MRIMFVSPFPPHRDGLARYTKQLADQLDATGKHRVMVAHGQHISFSPKQLRSLRHFIWHERPQVVHVQYTIAAYGLAALPMWQLLFRARREQGFRLVVTFHEVKRETSLLGPLGAWYMRFIARRADMLCVHTHEAARILTARCGVPPHAIRVIPHPLYEYEQTGATAASWRKELGIGRRPMVLFFGYIHVDKGVDHLIRAFALARQKDKKLQDAVLIIAGSVRERDSRLFKFFEKKDRVYEAQLHALVHELSLDDHVRFVPYVPDEYVRGCFKAATCAVLPYTNLEQSGVVNIALACGTPIIASKLGGLGETLAGTPGLVPPADDHALARTLRKFLTQPDIRRQTVAQYKDIARERTVPVIAGQLEELYASFKSPKLRIACVVPNYPPHMGGTEQVAQYSAEGLAQSDYRVSVYTARSTRIEKTRGVDLHGLRSFSAMHTTILPGLLPALLRMPRADIMHIHYSGEVFLTEWAALAARLRRIPYVVHVHNDPLPSGMLGFLLPAYRRFVLGPVLRRAAGVLALTPAGKRAVAARFGVATERIAVLPNAVRPMFFAAPPHRKRGALRVLFVGRLSHEKDVALLVRAVARTGNCTLDIVGDGRERQTLTKLAAELKAPVTFWGPLQGKALVARYRAADVFGLASVDEPFGIVLLEAMASGLAVVAADTPGVHDIVAGAGVLVAARTAEDFAHELRRLQDTALLSQTQQACRARADKFTIADAIRRLESIYARISKGAA